MPRLFYSLPMLIWLALGVIGKAYADESRIPSITAQGFDMSVSQEGILGAFGQIRIRFEVPDRIAELYIKERSYDVDLAMTPETAHFRLFGVKTQVRQLTDVTLNFQNYINEKIEAEGDYTFDLRVTDRKGRSATGSLTVRILMEHAPETQSNVDAVAVESFKFERIGNSAVSGAENFGISWRTIDSKEVLIELYAKKGSPSKLIEITPADYEHITTRTQLEQKINDGHHIASLLLPTTGGKAAGAVFGIIKQGEHYILRVGDSETSLSRRGTRVLLAGEFKH